MPKVFAAADIGSNTAHLLVAEHGAAGLTRLANESEWLSLGQVVSHDGIIPKTLVTKLVATLKAFRSRASSMKAQGIYVFATEAVRRAKNHGDVLRLVAKEVGLQVDLISPQREAELGLKGALLDVPIPGKFVFAESGGGSVQVASCLGPEIFAETSMPIGTGVLIDKASLTHPTSERSFAKARKLVDSAMSDLPSASDVTAILASGGVARGLWRALHPDGEPTICREELEFLAWACRRIDNKTITSRYCVKAKRAITLLPGAMVYLALMEKYGLPAITVSQFGVREGAVLEMSQGKIVPCVP